MISFKFDSVSLVLVWRLVEFYKNITPSSQQLYALQAHEKECDE